MATGQSLWVGASDDLVLDAQGARVASAGLWATNSADPFDVRLGLVWSGDSQLLVGTSGYSVNVDPHHFVGSKGSANGPYLGVNKTTTAVTVPAAPALGNKRIDVIWVAQTDKHSTISADASTAIVYGYTTGSPTSGTPSKPAISGAPGGALEVGTVTWDSSSVVATATNAAQCTLTTTGLWTVTKGSPIPVRSQAERDAISAPYNGMQVQRLDIPGALDTYDGSTWGDWVNLTLAGGVSGTLKIRARGKTIDIAADVTGTFPAGFTALSAAGAIAAANRPTITPPRGVAYVGSGTEMGTVEITTAGTVNLQCSNAHTIGKFNFPYPAG